MNERRAPLVALGALGVTVLAAAVVIGDVNVGNAVRLPALLLVGVFALGAAVSSARWSGHRPRPAPFNLGLTFVVAFTLIVTRATKGTGDPPGGLHSVAEVFLIVLAIRSFALTDATRLRSALLMSMGAVLAACASGPLTANLGPAVLWLVAAVVTLLALVEVSLADLPRLAGSTLRPTRPGRTLAAAAAVLGVVALATLAVVVVDPDAGAPQPRPGEQAAGPPQGRYDSLSNRMDTSARFKPNRDVVMVVQAPAPDFWRGQSFDRWDGRTWTRSAVRSSFPAPGSGYVQPGVGDLDVGGQTFVQHVTVRAPSMQLLFGAYRVDQIDSPVSGMVVHGDGSIELRAPIGRGTEYTVVSLRHPVTVAALRAQDPARSELPPYITQPYLQLPDVPARVTALARQITDGQPTAYDKVQAIHRWLAANVQYTLDIPPLPDGADAVDQFLFVDKKGFCEQIASASAVLLRSVGVPARVATGYVPGEESLLGGEFTVRADDAHAWVEVWFPGIGWQPFDPTASVPLAGDSTRTAGDRLAGVLRRAAPWLVAIFAMVLVVAAVGFAIGVVRRRRAFATAPWAHRFAVRLEAAGAVRGRARSPSESPAEYARALATSVLPDDRLVAVGAVVSRAAYGATDPPLADRRWAEDVLADAERAAPRHRRRRRRRPRWRRRRR